MLLCTTDLLEGKQRDIGATLAPVWSARPTGKRSRCLREGSVMGSKGRGGGRGRGGRAGRPDGSDLVEGRGGRGRGRGRGRGGGRGQRQNSPGDLPFCIIQLR